MTNENPENNPTISSLDFQGVTAHKLETAMNYMASDNGLRFESAILENDDQLSAERDANGIVLSVTATATNLTLEWDVIGEKATLFQNDQNVCETNIEWVLSLV